MKSMKRCIFLFITIALLLGSAASVHAAEKRTITSKINSLSAQISDPGYDPRRGQVLPIIASLSAENYKAADKFRLEIVIKNESKQTVYSAKRNVKAVKFQPETQTADITLNWNGTASRRVSSDLKKGEFVPKGTYTVTAKFCCIRAENANKGKKAKAVFSFYVKGADEVTAGTPLYTGNKNIDYLAELMVQEAGIRLDMSDKEKIKRVWDYMVTHFHHSHNTEELGDSYDLTALAAEIKAFKKTTKQLYRDGKIGYSNKYTNQKKYMVRRGGQCNNHSMIFAILCNHVGINAGLYHGQVRSGDSWMPHYWNYAYENGVKKVYDVDVNIQHYRGTNIPYTWYRISYEESLNSHQYSAS